jgi:hypothetical protein
LKVNTYPTSKNRINIFFVAKEVTNDETLQNFIKRKHPRKGERNRNKGQRPKSSQANSPKETSHKEERESLRTKPSNWVNQ